MAPQKDLTETLRKAVEAKVHGKAAFKQMQSVRPPDGKTGREVDVYTFDLSYETTSLTKEQIENWRLPGPSAKALAAAEKRGLKIKEILESKRDQGHESHRKPKIAYAWAVKARGSKRAKLYVVTQEGPVKSAADALRAKMG